MQKTHMVACVDPETAETLEHYYDNRLEKRAYRTPSYCKHKL